MKWHVDNWSDSCTQDINANYFQLWGIIIHYNNIIQNNNTLPWLKHTVCIQNTDNIIVVDKALKLYCWVCQGIFICLWTFIVLKHYWTWCLCHGHTRLFVPMTYIHTRLTKLTFCCVPNTVRTNGLNINKNMWHILTFFSDSEGQDWWHKWQFGKITFK